MNFIKKVILYRSYKKILKKNRLNLESNYNLRVDRAGRMYTIVNVDKSLFEEPYNLRSSDINNISEKYIRQYITSLSDYLNSIGIKELYDYYEPIKKVDKYSYLLIFGYRLFNSVSYNRVVYYVLLPIFILSIIALIITLLL